MFYPVFFLYILIVSAMPKSRNQKITLGYRDSRIINGQPATLGQFPWQAALYVTGTDKSIWFCGGTIIGKEWILTAGHCAYGANSTRVLSGLTKLNETSAESTSTEFVIHSNYNPKTLEADIALIKLDQPLSFDYYTQPIILSSDPLKDMVRITISGWGNTADGSGISTILNYVELVTITTDECENSYGKGEILESMICATSDTEETKSTCNGDSGGPVVTNVDIYPVHVAIVSFVSDNGCDSGDPSGYTRTAYYREWIKKHTGI